MNKNQYYQISSNFGWVHRTPLKVAINPILRTIQFWTDCPYVIVSITD